MTQDEQAGQRLGAPRVGTWRPEVGLGALVTPGTRLGQLRTHGVWAPVLAPDGAAGAVLAVAGAWSWHGYGGELVRLGEAHGIELEAAARPAEQGVPDDVTVVRAEIDGTIYLRPEPGAAAFVEVGQRVDALVTVALTEVMKTFSPVRAPMTGEVVQVKVTDGAAVTVGQALFWMRG